MYQIFSHPIGSSQIWCLLRAQHERSLGASLGLAYTVGGRSLFVSPTNGRRGHAVARVRRPEKSRDWVTQLLLKKFGVETVDVRAEPGGDCSVPYNPE